jgi:serine/threonine protein kinase
MLKDLRLEIDCQSLLPAESVVKFWGWRDTVHIAIFDYAFLVMGLCDMDLERFVTFNGWRDSNSNDPIPLPLFHSIISQLLKAYKSCHSGATKWVAHRDVKPQNVLVSRRGPGKWDIKLCDFAFSKAIDRHLPASTVNPLGTIADDKRRCWAAPEVVKCESDHQKFNPLYADIWSLGCVLYYFGMSGQSALCNVKSDTGDNQKIKDRINRFNTLILGHSRDVTLFQDLLSRMTSQIPARRITAHDAFEHPVNWSAEKRLLFVKKLVDKVREKTVEYVLFMAEIDKIAKQTDWVSKFPPTLKAESSAHRAKYHKTPLASLPRTPSALLEEARHLETHASSLAPVQLVFDAYPNLFIIIYNLMLDNQHFKRLFIED